MSTGTNQTPPAQPAGVPDPHVGTLQKPPSQDAGVPDPHVGVLQSPPAQVAEIPDPHVGTLQKPPVIAASTQDDMGPAATIVTLVTVSTADTGSMGGEATSVVQTFDDTVFQVRSDPRHQAAQGQSSDVNPYHAKRSQDFTDTTAYAMSITPVVQVQNTSPVKEGPVFPRERVRGQQGLM
jgi:hypothetical protein